MNHTAQAVLDTCETNNVSVHDLKIVERPIVWKEQVTGLCMNCSHLSTCTFPMRGKAMFCEEYD